MSRAATKAAAGFPDIVSAMEDPRFRLAVESKKQ